MVAKTIREQHDGLSKTFQSLSSNTCYSSPNDACGTKFVCDRDGCARQIRQTFAALVKDFITHFETEREAMRRFNSTEFALHHYELHGDLFTELNSLVAKMGTTDRLVQHIGDIKRFEQRYLHHLNTTDAEMMKYVPA